jgi:hypothetical protein
MARAIGGIFLMDLTNYDLLHSRIEAICACGQPVAGMVIKDTCDPLEARHFFADAFRSHIQDGAAGHALSLEIHELPDHPTHASPDAHKAE